MQARMECEKRGDRMIVTLRKHERNKSMQREHLDRRDLLIFVILLYRLSYNGTRGADISASLGVQSHVR